jgi:hypothetical protein
MAQNLKRWQAPNTWVFVAGLLEWENSQRFKPFSKLGRLDEKIVEFFRQAGVPGKQIIYLQDKEATFLELNRQLKWLSEQIKNGDFVFFYYAGHGTYNSKDYFLVCYDHNDGREWSISQIFKQLDQNPADFTCLLTADCCHSGALALEAEKYNSKFAAISSVIPEKTSTGDWTFSNALLEVLEGKVFSESLDNQGFNLSQTAEYIENVMAIVEKQKISKFIPDKSNNFLINNQLKPKSHPLLGQIIKIPRNAGEYLARVVDVKDTQLELRTFTYLSDKTEWLEEDKILPYKTLKPLSIGAEVEVFYPAKGCKKWYEAKILKNFKDILYYIQYDIDNTYEWVDTDRIRQPWL